MGSFDAQSHGWRRRGSCPPTSAGSKDRKSFGGFNGVASASVAFIAFGKSYNNFAALPLLY